MKKLNLKLKNNQKGITLIALVITIIVLLILAAVSIATLTGENGILTRANDAKEQTEIADEREKVELSTVAALANNNGGEIIQENLEIELGKYFTSGKYNVTAGTNEEGAEGYIVTISDSGRKYFVDKNGNVTNLTTGNNPGGDIEEDIAGKTFDTDTDITVGGVSVTIPAGATVSGIPGEYENVEDGFVIYITNGDTITDWNADTDPANGIKDVQEKYDQFVWVPVKTAYITEEEITDQTGSTNYEKLKNYLTEANEGKAESEQIYPMAIEVSEGTYKGILYDFEDGTDSAIPTPKDYTTTSIYSEPAYLTNSSSADGSSHNNVGITQSSLQSEFNTMVTRVSEKKGFWVGRYETSHMVNDNTQDATNQIKVIKGTTKGINKVFWYRMYAQQKSYSNLALTKSASVTSSMIWGSQWDQIMIWMKSIPSKYTDTTYTGKFYVTNAVSMGNYGSINGVDDGWSNTISPASTGYSESYKVKNIFDLAGNVYDWTLEGHYTSSSRVIRRRLLLRC